MSIWERLHRYMYFERYNPKSVSSKQKEERENEMPKNEFKRNGLKAVKTCLDTELDSLTSINLYVAVIGCSGSGKSSFINSLRNLKPLQPGSARVGICNETRKECTPYEHPENNSFVIWDLPGVDTEPFPRQRYLEKVEYDKYDFFVLISKGRFTEADLWLAKEVKKQKKQVFFVRSKIDTDITDERRIVGNDFNEESFLQEVKQYTENELRSKMMADFKVFLISNFDTDKYDFGILNNEMLFSCDSLKRDALALSLAAVTREVIGEKKRVLAKRIHSVAVKIATTSSKLEQKRIFQHEINTYQKQFNIDNITLYKTKDMLTFTDDNLREFRVAFDKFEHDSGVKMKTPTATRDSTTLWNCFSDFFTWSTEDKLMYGFSRIALEINIELLYQKKKSFFDETRLA